MKMIILFLFLLLIHVHGLTELIIILGNNNPNIQNERIQKAIEYLNNDSLNKRILYLSGGVKKYFLRSVNQMKETSESLLMYSHLNEQMTNFKDINVIMDEKSTNSAENFVYLKKWILENYPLHDFIYTIITSDFHEKRTLRLFNSLFPLIKPKMVLSITDCYHCWTDENIHLRNVDKDIKEAIVLLNE